MNWLAHIFISENHIDYQLGNLLADPLKGKSWQGSSEKLEEGFRMHGSIDSFTDSHEVVSKSKSRLGPKGYLKGVIIDIVYDHLLIQNWERYSKKSLEKFIADFYEKAIVAVDSYPEVAKSFVNRLIKSKNLTSYGTVEGLEAAFARIDRRLSGRVLAKESAVDYMPIIKREIRGIEEDFLTFFPGLIRHFKSNSEELDSEHWLR